MVTVILLHMTYTCHVIVLTSLDYKVVLHMIKHICFIHYICITVVIARSRGDNVENKISSPVVLVVCSL